VVLGHGIICAEHSCFRIGILVLPGNGRRNPVYSGCPSPVIRYYFATILQIHPKEAIVYSCFVSRKRIPRIRTQNHLLRTVRSAGNRFGDYYIPHRRRLESVTTVEREVNTARVCQRGSREGQQRSALWRKGASAENGSCEGMCQRGTERVKGCVSGERIQFEAPDAAASGRLERHPG